MQFDTVPVESARGAILAHGVRAGGKLLRKGRVLSAEDISQITQAGIESVTVARLEDGDIPEDEAASRIAARLTGGNIRIAAAFTGRANLYATADGVFVVDQARVNAFAAATEDPQWIHVDPARAKARPFGGPIAHGFLTLSLIPYFFETGFAVRESRMVLNYGLNKVRFTKPVPVGSRLRAGFKLLAMEEVAGGSMQLTVEVAVEAEGMAKPVCVDDRKSVV